MQARGIRLRARGALPTPRRCSRLRIAATAAAPLSRRTPRFERDTFGVKRVAYEERGWEVWNWRGIDVNYISYGNTGPPVILIHGFGASSYQWRYNIPELAKNHRVYALDLVGFGWSEKVVTDYTGGEVWSDQIADFIREFVGSEGAYIAGNSLGGFAALATAARNPDVIKGIIGLNIAGQFAQDVDLMPTVSQAEENNIFLKWRRQLGDLFRQLLLIYSFHATRSRVRKILLAVYHNKNNVDDDLVRSIEAAAEDPHAFDVYCKLIQSTLSKAVTLDELLEVIRVPMLLLWGMKDPWITPKKGYRIVEAYKAAEFVPLDAGHCVQDECPEIVNEQLMSWIERNER